MRISGERSKSGSRRQVVLAITQIILEITLENASSSAMGIANGISEHGMDMGTSMSSCEAIDYGSDEPFGMFLLDARSSFNELSLKAMFQQYGIFELVEFGLHQLLSSFCPTHMS